MKKSSTDDFFRLNLQTRDGWQNIKYIGGALEPAGGRPSISIDNDSIMIFGGYSDKKGNLNAVHLLRVQQQQGIEHKLEEKGKLQKEA